MDMGRKTESLVRNQELLFLVISIWDLWQMAKKKKINGVTFLT